jgi:hypothetical protein
MAEQGMYSTTDLARLLAERGVELSAAQVFGWWPKRRSCSVGGPWRRLCDILG